MDEPEYRRRFRSDPTFGALEARGIADGLGYAGMPLERIREGTSLVFALGPDLFLKLTPPGYAESHVAEREALLRVRGRPGWSVRKDLDAAGKDRLARELGAAAAAIRAVPLAGYEREFGPWERYLAGILASPATAHRERGVSPEWVVRIESFLGGEGSERAAWLKDGMGEPGFTHADLNAAHVLFDDAGSVAGIIDFADAMRAPPEVELLLPCLDYFRGDGSGQAALFAAAGLGPRPDGRRLLALALVNRFIVFHDWFDRELAAGVDSLEALAEVVFPSA